MVAGMMRSMRQLRPAHLHNGGSTMISKEIEIDGKLVPFKASAAVPRLYRSRFGRDIFRDLMRLGTAVGVEAGTENIPISDLELFENVAYIMALHADPKQPDTPEEWLDQFDTFSIYTVLPQLLDLWHLNIGTDVAAKKKRSRAAVK